MGDIRTEDGRSMALILDSANKALNELNSTLETIIAVLIKTEPATKRKEDESSMRDAMLINEERAINANSVAKQIAEVLYKI